MAGALGGARPVRDGPRGHEPAQVLHVDDVPVPIGRPAHRALVHRDPERRAGPLPADARLNVFFPIGFDAFGLPAENAAIKSGGHPFTWTMQNIENMRRQFRTMGATFSWKHEVVTGGPVLLPLEPVDVPAVPGEGPRLPQAVAGRLVSQRRDPGPRAGRRRRSPLLALRRAGREARPGAVVPAHHRLRRRAAGLQRHRLARAHPHPADELDRSLRGRGDRLRDRAVRHHPGGEAIRVFTTRPDTLFGATFMVLAPGASARRDADRARERAEVEAYVEQAAAPDGDRPAVDRPREDRRRDRGQRDQPDQRRAHPDLHRRLRAVRLRHRRDHGRARPRRARLRLRPAVRPADPARGRRPGTAADDPMADAYVAHADRRAPGGQRRSSTGCRPTRAAGRSSRSWPRRARPSPRSPIDCATG